MCSINFQAYSLLHLVQCNVEGVEGLRKSVSPELVAALRRLCCLFALYYLESNAGLFMQVKLTPYFFLLSFQG